MANRVPLHIRLRCRIAKRFWKEVFSYKALNMPGVARDLLCSYHVIWPALPIEGIPTWIAIYDLIFVQLWGKSVTIQPFGLIFSLAKCDWMLSSVHQNISFYLASCVSESFIFARDVAGVAWQVLFLVIRWSCKCCHFLIFILFLI